LAGKNHGKKGIQHQGKFVVLSKCFNATASCIPAVFLLFSYFSLFTIKKGDSLRIVKQTLLTEIETVLRKIMDEYSNKQNTEATWTLVRSEADLFLYNYFRNRKLLGNKPQQAYYIQIGPQTMTNADISANRRILIAGVSVYKPAEFTIIRIETNPKNTSKF
jgi:phage tail sheath protein FI